MPNPYDPGSATAVANHKPATHRCVRCGWEICDHDTTYASAAVASHRCPSWEMGSRLRAATAADIPHTTTPRS